MTGATQQQIEKAAKKMLGTSVKWPEESKADYIQRAAADLSHHARYLVPPTDCILPRALVAELLDLLDTGGEHGGMWVVEPGMVHDFTNAWEATLREVGRG